MHQQYMLLKLRKPILKFTCIQSIMSIVFATFKHPKLLIRIKYVANCLYLHDSYITKFDFMNCAVAKLVLAWL